MIFLSRSGKEHCKMRERIETLVLLHEQETINNVSIETRMPFSQEIICNI